jgi:uncharacterized protein YbaP (TraB family)
MKKITTVIVSFLATLGFTQTALPQSTPAPTTGSLLYEITRKDLAKPSYIFGTIHAICPADMVPVEGLTPYVDKTDQMLMEIDMDDPVEMGSMTQGIVIPGGKTLKDYLTPEQFAKVDEFTKEMLGYSAENVKSIKPTFLTVMAIASPKALGCTPSVYDMLLMQTAMGKKKPIVGLETVASQVKVIDSKPIEKQAKELYDLAVDPQKSVKEFKALTAAYKLQDAEKLFERSIETSTGDKEFQAKLLDERNNSWIPKIESAIKEKTTFIAVGAGHLGGKAGVINLLRAKGYDVKPVKLPPSAGGGN